MVFTFFIRLSGCCKQRCHHQWSVLREACKSHRAVPGLLRDWWFWTWFHRNPKGAFHLITSWPFKCLQESLVLVYWRKVWLSTKTLILVLPTLNRDAMAAWTSARTGSSTRRALVTFHQMTPLSSGWATKRSTCWRPARTCRPCWG